MDTTAAAATVPADHGAGLLALLDGIGEGVWMRTGETITLNDAARRLLALGPGDPVPGAEALAPRDLDGAPLSRDLPAEARRTGRPVHARVRGRRADGAERIFDLTIGSVGGDGHVVLFRDVTEDHVREQLTAGLLERLFTELPTPSLVWEPVTFRIEAANRAFAELVGYPLDEIVGATPPYPWWAEDAAAPPEAWLAGFDASVRWEHLYRRRDGTLVPTAGEAFTLRDETGRVERLVGLVTDLSERREFEMQLLQSGKMAAIGELAAGVAHEINNPLFAILGLVEFLLMEVEPGTKAHERLRLIQDTGLEIKEIVRALLDFAREPSDEFGLVSLGDVAAKTVELVRRTSAGKGVELVESYCQEDTTVQASANQLKQVLLNLLTNAQHAVGDDGTIAVEVRRDGEWVTATVADDGPGIPPAILAKIFDPFFTTKRSVGGSGLGLSVSLGIAQIHGGELTVASTPGSGATFTLRLPLACGSSS